MKITLQRTRRILDRMARQRILVVGDLMLDRYIYGGVARISPEAPVPVLDVNREISMPGGASNVAWNIREMGAGAVVAGILGKDHAGTELKKVLGRGGVGVGGVWESSGQRTTVKMRVIAERQQVVRVDFEERHALSAPARSKFLRQVRDAVRRSTGVILEDYDKGVISQEVVDVVLATARERRIPVGLDPKDTHELDFSGLTVATPNRKEAFIIAGIKDPGAADDPLRDAGLLQVGERLLEKWNLAFLLITLGPHGMLLMAPGTAPRHVPTRAREVFDVSGAGDTVIGVCTAALAAGASHLEAAELANYAAGVVVGKLGTASCSRTELLEYMRRDGITT